MAQFEAVVSVVARNNENKYSVAAKIGGGFGAFSAEMQSKFDQARSSQMCDYIIRITQTGTCEATTSIDKVLECRYESSALTCT